MRVNNATYKAVKMKWSGITFPLKEGTPVNIGGNVANDGTAIGLVAGTVYVEPVVSDGLYILVGGDVELAEVEKNSGITLTSAAKAAMSGIRFYKPGGSVDDSADSDTHYTLPKASESVLGGVKIGTNVSIDENGAISVPTIPVAANVAASDAEALADLVTSFNSLLSALKTAGLMEADAE